MSLVGILTSLDPLVESSEVPDAGRLGLPSRTENKTLKAVCSTSICRTLLTSPGLLQSELAELAIGGWSKPANILQMVWARVGPPAHGVRPW